MSLAVVIPVVGVIVLFLYFAVEGASDDPWGRKKSE
jgi:hypothetical protein